MSEQPDEELQQKSVLGKRNILEIVSEQDIDRYVLDHRKKFQQLLANPTTTEREEEYVEREGEKVDSPVEGDTGPLEQAEQQQNPGDMIFGTLLFV